MKRGFKFFFLASLLFSFLFWNSIFLKKERNKQKSFAPPSSYLQKPFIKLLSFGFVDLLEEIIFLGLLEDLGKESFSVSEEVKLEKKILSFSSLSPRIESFYTLSCFVLLFELKHPKTCLSILKSGIKTLPLSWRPLLTRGYLEAFWLGDYENAASSYEKASLLEGAPSFLEAFSKSLRQGRVFVPEKERLEILLFDETEL